MLFQQLSALQLPITLRTKGLTIRKSRETQTPVFIILKLLFHEHNFLIVFCALSFECFFLSAAL